MKMPKPQFFRNITVAALVLGVCFLIANLYLGGMGYSVLAKILFACMILCDLAFMVGAMLWMYRSAWLRESTPQGPPGAMPGGKMPAGLTMGGPMPGAPKPGAPMVIRPGAPVPGAPAAQKPRPPQP
jgi:hypothetical protein